MLLFMKQLLNTTVTRVLLRAIGEVGMGGEGSSLCVCGGGGGGAGHFMYHDSTSASKMVDNQNQCGCHIHAQVRRCIATLPAINTSPPSFGTPWE